VSFADILKMFFNLATLGLLPLALGAPLLTPRDGTAIPGKYVVVLKPNAARVSGVLSNLAAGAVGQIQHEHVYELGNFKGFSASLTDAQVTALKADSQVRQG
jgi:hypothetical protein